MISWKGFMSCQDNDLVMMPCMWDGHEARGSVWDKASLRVLGWRMPVFWSTHPCCHVTDSLKYNLTAALIHVPVTYTVPCPCPLELRLGALQRTRAPWPALLCKAHIAEEQFDSLKGCWVFFYRCSCRDVSMWLSFCFQRQIQREDFLCLWFVIRGET